MDIDMSSNKVAVIGGITADMEGHPYQRLIYGDSNPGKIVVSYGGVGRNITENLGHMGTSVSFYSVAGDDFLGRGAVRELADLGIDVSGIQLLPDKTTAVYISILDLVGDLELALCNMDALEGITTDFIDQVADSAKEAKIIALDTNLTSETLAYAVERFKGKPLFLDPVSAVKAERAKAIIGGFHTIKPNRLEAEVLSGIEIRSPEALETAGQWFIDAGVKQVFITLSAAGVYYKDKQVSGIMKPFIDPSKCKSATGAGDAFSAAILYSFINDFDTTKIACYGMAAATIAMESESSVNPLMSSEEMERRVK
jgi:pseudouridine kinase